MRAEDDPTAARKEATRKRSGLYASPTRRADSASTGAAANGMALCPGCVIEIERSCGSVDDEPEWPHDYGEYAAAAG